VRGFVFIEIATPMSFNDLFENCTFLAYRLSGYALSQLADDAAILALMFC